MFFRAGAGRSAAASAILLTMVCGLWTLVIAQPAFAVLTADTLIISKVFNTRRRTVSTTGAADSQYIEIYNATPDSFLDVFPIIDFTSIKFDEK